MSGTGVQNVSLMSQQGNQAPTDYVSQQMQIQRALQLAKALQDQGNQDIPILSGGGAQAPIAWTSMLAKVLDKVGSSMQSNRAISEQKSLSAQQQADALKAIQSFGQNPDTQGLVPGAPKPSAPMQYSLQAPSVIPGQAGPSATVTAQLPDIGGIQAGTIPGGPTTLAQKQQMLPQMAMQGADNPYLQSAVPMMTAQMKPELERQNKLWENSLPMSTAAAQTIAAQGQQSHENAEFANQLPMTAAQRAANQVALGNLQETRNYHRQMSGSGLMEDGSPNPAVQSWVGNVASGNATLANVPMGLRNAVSNALQSAPKQIFTPLAGQRFTLESSRITHPLTTLPQYQLTANGLPYLQRIDAAMKTPGSVSDQDLLDSLTKLNTAGNAVTDAQIKVITDGKSYSDWAGTLANKFKNGGVLSDNQRGQIKEIANNIYSNYKKGYQPVYDQAVSQLRAAGVPEAFWTIPDLNKLTAGSDKIGDGGSSGAQVAPAGTQATGPNGKVLTSDGKGGWH